LQYKEFMEYSEQLTAVGCAVVVVGATVVVVVL